MSRSIRELVEDEVEEKEVVAEPVGDGEEDHDLPSASKKRKISSEPPLPENGEDELEALLLVDSQEPPEFLRQLQEAHVRCERRGLPTFDFLWVVRRKGYRPDGNAGGEYVLDYGAERKEINDLAHSLNTNNRETGLSRSVEQKMKMNQSGVSNKYYLVQGNIGSVYRHDYRFNQTMKKRIYRNIKEMENGGYQVHKFHISGVSDIVDLLKSLHAQIESQVKEVSASGRFSERYSLTYTALVERSKWVTKVGSARKALSKGNLGEKKLLAILEEFRTEHSFRSAHEELGNAAMIERLVSLKTSSGRSFLSKAKAEVICSRLLAKRSAQGAMQQSSRNKSSTPRRRRATKSPRPLVSPEVADNSKPGDGSTAKRALFLG